MDPLGRRYVHRPIFYNTLLSRIVRTASKLMDVFNELTFLQGERESMNSKDEFRKNISKSLAKIKDGFELLEVITVDIDTLLFRDYSEIETMYEKFITQLGKEKARLEADEKVDSEKLEEIEKHIKELKEEHSDIKKEEKEEEFLKGDLEKLQTEYADLGELIETFGMETQQFIQVLHHTALDADLVAKADVREVVNPEISIHEISMKGNFRLLRLIKRDAIEIRQLHEKTESLRSALDIIKGRVESFNEANDDLDALKKEENVLLKDTGKVEHYEEILLHRLLHSFLHRIDAEEHVNPELFKTVKEDVRNAHIKAQEILGRIRTQTKKLNNDIKL